VIKHGQVVSIRDDIAVLLKGTAAADRKDVVLVDTPVLLHMQEDCGSVRPVTPADVTTMQVSVCGAHQVCGVT
jgi:hypothetical protein